VKNGKGTIMMSRFQLSIVVLLAAAAIACGDDDPTGPTNPNEVITTITLTMTPAGGGTPITATWDDPDGDGGNAPSIDPITLQNGTNYTTAVTIFNKLANPTQEVTPEIFAERDEHQLFYTGTAVKGPATSNTDTIIEQVHTDQDTNGFPIGLSTTINTVKVGTGVMTVTLRHMPLVNGNTVKTATLADTVKTSGLTALPGSNDFSIDFNVEVQ
jgi:hypothetical protein